jgi:hypothetical protein
MSQRPRTLLPSLFLAPTRRSGSAREGRVVVAWRRPARVWLIGLASLALLWAGAMGHWHAVAHALPAAVAHALPAAAAAHGAAPSQQPDTPQDTTATASEHRAGSAECLLLDQLLSAAPLPALAAQAPAPAPRAAAPLAPRQASCPARPVQDLRAQGPPAARA